MNRSETIELKKKGRRVEGEGDGSTLSDPWRRKGGGKGGLRTKREAKVEAKRKREMEFKGEIVRVVRVVPKCRFGGRDDRQKTDRQKRNKVTSNLPSQSKIIRE